MFFRCNLVHTNQKHLTCIYLNYDHTPGRWLLTVIIARNVPASPLFHKQYILIATKCMLMSQQYPLITLRKWVLSILADSLRSKRVSTCKLPAFNDQTHATFTSCNWKIVKDRQQRKYSNIVNTCGWSYLWMVLHVDGPTCGWS